MLSKFSDMVLRSVAALIMTRHSGTLIFRVLAWFPLAGLEGVTGITALRLSR
jgi:hypothetical protein